MKTCSVCRLCCEDNASDCPENHGTLIAERSGTCEMIPNYRLDSLLERDVVGASYLATNIALDQPFVVKIIDQNQIIGAGEQARQTLQREAEAAAHFNHSNIAGVYESGWLDGGDFYVVTEPVGDKTLQGFLRNTGALPEVESVKIAQQTAEGLIAAHAAGIIHRAVSPANIILTRGGQNQILVKLRNFDFGGIKQHAAAGDFAAGTKIDTLRYLSPEQFSEKSVDEQTDVYSLGIVLYEMLCGRSPFVAPTSEAIADRQIDEQPLMQLRFDVRALLTHTIKKALQRRPAARLQTGDFARQLRHISLLILPLGENLPATPQVLLSNEVTSDAQKFAGSEIAEQSPREIITADKSETAATNEFAEQTNIVKAAEDTSDEAVSLGELAPIFVMKNGAEADLSATEPISYKNTDANIDPFENAVANVNSFESKPVFAGQPQVDKIPFESDAGQTEENVLNEMPTLGELAPIFVVKNEFDSDSFSAKTVSAESENANINLPESNPIVEQNRVDGVPLEFTGENQANEVPFEANIGQTDENAANKISPLGELAPVFFEKNRVAAPPFESEPVIAESRTLDTESIEPEVFVFPEEITKNTYRKAAAAPNFSDYSEENHPSQRPFQSQSALVGAGLIAVLVSVMLGAFLYYQMQDSTASEQTTTAAAPTMTQTASDTADDKNDTAEIIRSDKPETKNSAPLAVERKSPTAPKLPAQRLPEQTVARNDTTVQKEPVQETAARENPAATGGKPQTELNSALDDWISATNSRDVDQQMNYYAPKLNAYYLTRNASQGAVRAEKRRVFSRADAIDIQTGKPDITVSPDGQKATMRFRKKYDIKQGGQTRRGEVLQELQWVKSGDGWRIVSERDVKVINH